jgi:hypothetical protein
VVRDVIQWWKNGDHPLDYIGEKVVDYVKLGDLRPDLLGPNGWKRITHADIPEEAYYERVEGAYVRYFRHPDIRGLSCCNRCGQKMDDHGWIDSYQPRSKTPDDGEGITVCPGDMVPVIR